MRLRTTLFLVSLACSAASLTHPGVARAQDDATTAEAKKHFVAGTKAFSKGKFADAAQDFEAAAALKPNAVALYTAALAWEQASQSERAADDYGRALSLVSGGLNAQQQNTARDRLAALEKVLGTLAITGPDGYKVQLDQFTPAPTPVRLHGTGGTHALSVFAPGKSPEKRDVLLEGGQTQKLDVTPAPATPEKPDHEAPPPPPPKKLVVEKSVSHLSPMKAVGFTSIGIGATTALAAILLGISAQDAGDAYNAAPSHAGFVHANALADWTTGAWITAGVFLAAGVTLVLIPEKSSSGEGAAPSAPKPEEQKIEDSARREHPAAAAGRARLVLSPALGGLVLRGSF
jgi:tetratricopeptide (TPR) repeat protein